MDWFLYVNDLRHERVKISPLAWWKLLVWSVQATRSVKVSMPAEQVLPLTGYIFEASYSTSATQINKI